MHKILLALLFLSKAYALPCGPDEVYVKEHKVRSYQKSDGNIVKPYFRKAYCRKISQHYFQNNTDQNFKGIKTNIKSWKEEETKIVEKLLVNLPLWLRKYKFSELLRGDSGGHPLNPAATIPKTKTLILFDNFFSSPIQQDILIHEIAHIAIYDFSPEEVLKFSKLSGWKIDIKKTT